MDHPHFGGLCSRKWANGLKNELADWLKNNLPSLSTPSLYSWYASFKKSAGLGGANSLASLDGAPITSPGALDSVELDDLKERFKMLQKHFIAIQKKEQYLKQTLI